jgi:predicted transcriptional regulator
MDINKAENSGIVEAVARITASYLANNAVEISKIGSVVTEVRRAVAQLIAGYSEPASPQEPAVPINKSVHKDYIICLEDGKKLKMLRRHLLSAYKMTPEDYRKKWNLPDSYPMTAASYSEKRSGLAKKIGLGQRRVA